jgi:hypothetical protein
MADTMRGRFESLVEQKLDELSSDESGRIAAALASIAASAANINMRVAAAIGFLAAGEFHNIYRVSAVVAAQLGVTREHVLRSALGPFYLRRISFDGHFNDGEEYCYAALYVGGAGLSDYGPFCFVFELSSLAAMHASTCVDSDTLDFVDSVGAIDVDRLTRHIVSIDERQYLAVIKWWDSIVKGDSHVPNACDKRSYVEIVVAGAPRMEHLRDLLTTKAFVSEYASLLMRHGKRLLSIDERNLLADYNTLSVLAAEKGVTIAHV